MDEIYKGTFSDLIGQNSNASLSKEIFRQDYLARVNEAFKTSTEIPWEVLGTRFIRCGGREHMNPLKGRASVGAPGCIGFRQMVREKGKCQLTLLLVD